MTEYELTLAGRKIGRSHAPFVIAELSGNHNGSLDRALAIVDAAAAAGAHAIKLQTYTADTITIDSKGSDFYIDDPESLWYGHYLYELYEQAHTPWEWHETLFGRARERGLVAFSTPFDESAVEFLETLNTPFYKISSFENADIPLIRKAASTGKPLIISTGMATIAELDETVRTLRESGCNRFALLKCTSTYPATPENSNVLTIPHMRELFRCEVGLSDHTMGVGAAVAAVAHGASVIEKHFTLRRDDGGVDSAFSMEPEEMRQLVGETERAWLSLGSVQYGASDVESSSLKFRRSLYIVKDMEIGDTFTPDNLRSIRPGIGLPPKYYEKLIGRPVKRTVKRGTATSWDIVG